jgi:hypothetical protein
VSSPFPDDLQRGVSENRTVSQAINGKRERRERKIERKRERE